MWIPKPDDVVLEDRALELVERARDCVGGQGIAASCMSAAVAVRLREIIAEKYGTDISYYHITIDLLH